jgi:hypothetical protein
MTILAFTVDTLEIDFFLRQLCHGTFLREFWHVKVPNAKIKKGKMHRFAERNFSGSDRRFYRVHIFATLY